MLIELSSVISDFVADLFIKWVASTMEYSFLAARLSFTFDVHMCVFHLANSLNSAAAAIKSLNTGDVPQDWKLANVTAIFKKGKNVAHQIIDQLA